VDPETGKETYQFVAPQSYETESVIVNNELKERINTAFQSLKPAYRHIAQLYFWIASSTMKLPRFVIYPWELLRV